MVSIKRLLPVIFPLILISTLSSQTVSASRLSIEMGSGTTGVSVGGDVSFGYVLGGFSARFVDDFPWSYVPTKQSLTGACQNYKSEAYYPPEDNDPNTPPTSQLAVSCDGKGRFNDGDEWEVFGKVGWRVPRIPIFYLDLGAGISHQRMADLFIFCNGIPVPPNPNDPNVNPNWRTCKSSADFMTWGRIQDRYYPTFLWGMGVEVRKDFLLNIDYHTRRGPLLGMTWRF